MSGLAHLAIGALALAAALWLGARGWVASPDAAALLLGAAATSLLARIARALPHLALAGPRRSALRGAALQRAGLFGQRGAAAERAGGPRPEELLVRQLLCEGFAVVFALCAGLAAGAGRLLATAAVAALAVALLLRPALAIRALRALAQRFPGHLGPGFSRFLDAVSAALEPRPRLLALLGLATATAIAWLLDVAAAQVALLAFGFHASFAHAALVAVAAHLGVSLLPRAAGLGAVELLALLLLGRARPWVASPLPGVIALHALVAAWTVGAGRLAARRLGPGAAAAATSALDALQATARERRRGAAAFVAEQSKRSDPWLSVVIPAYNEARRIAPTLLSALLYLRELRAPFEILVVDDGSGDGTGQVVEDLAAAHPELRLLALPSNTGKGAAVRAGARAARGAWILLDDADGATPIVELERLVAAASRGADVAIGSRALAAPDVGVERRLLRAVSGRAFAFLVNAWVVPGVADTQCGFKLFRREAAELCFGQQQLDGFAFDVEILYLARRGGFRIEEVPVNWMNVEGSKVGLGPGLRAFADVVRIRSLHRAEAPAATEG